MALSDKDIVITPNRGSASAAPKIVFSAASSSFAGQDITLEVIPGPNASDGSTITFTGEQNGTLMAISDDIGGALFSVSNSSGLPLLEVSETGNVTLGLATGALGLPSGTTAQRPSVPQAGYERWNTETGSKEIYDGTAWVEIITDYVPSGSTILG
jgi:hypothetical protein